MTLMFCFSVGLLHEGRDDFCCCILCFFNFNLFCFQYYQYYLMSSLILRWFLPGDQKTLDVFEHGNKKTLIQFFLLPVTRK